MKKEKKLPPYKAHVFICTGCKYPGSREDSAKDFRKEVKSLAKEKWGKQEVRVSGVHCLGQCEQGIACAIYPKNEWVVELRPGDEKKLIDLIDEALIP